MPLLPVLSAFSTFMGKADLYLLPCPFKSLTGYDCPGCGFQRSLLALLKGNFTESIHLYPPLIPILASLLISLSANYWYKARSKRLVNTLFVLSAFIVMFSYLSKIMGSPIL